MTLTEVRQRVTPSRSDAVDAAVATTLTVLGIIGFRTTFSGGEELLVGVPAVIAGALIGYVLAKLRVPLLVAAALATITFFVLSGPLALRHRAVGGILPSPDAIGGTADGVVNGWIRLLTTLPPAGQAGDLLAVPYLCGFAGGALAVGLALRYPKQPVCVVPPAAVLVASVLMGTKRPASLLLQGAVFAAVTIAWVTARHRRGRELNQARMAPPRLAMAAGLLVVGGLGGIVVGPRLPGGMDNERYVLRDEVEPPFDPLTEPSALIGFRNYTDQDGRAEEVLTATGLPAGARLRISSMDAYDGLVWRSTGSGSVVAGQYLRVGAEIPTDGLGVEHEVHVEIHRPHGVWVPLGGDVSNLSFEGADAARLDEEVRVSIQSDTAAVPTELDAGDRYTFTAKFVDLPDEEALRELPLDGRFRRGDGGEVPEEFVRLSGEWAGGAQSAYAEMNNIAEQLRTEGGYTDGGPEARPLSAPGHSLARLVPFIAVEHPFGNGEQFAAAFGLMAQARGIPARVVLGFVNEDGDDEVTFKGEDIRAWVEIPVDGLGWVPIDATPPEDQLPEPVVDPRTKTPNPEPQPPPPTTVPPPTSVPEELESEDPDEEEAEESGGGIPGFVVAALVGVGVPTVLVGGPIAVVLGLKSRRRRRRRRLGAPSQRLSSSFAELVDFARDAGMPLPPRSTRTEQSAMLRTAMAPALATRSDAAVFGPDEPTDAEVEQAWAELTAARSELRSTMTQSTRLRAALNLTSLRTNR